MILSGDELNGNFSEACSRQRMHLALLKLNVTFSDAARPILSKSIKQCMYRR